MVEAMGIEPMSEKIQLSSATYLAFAYTMQPTKAKDICIGFLSNTFALRNKLKACSNVPSFIIRVSPVDGHIELTRAQSQLSESW